METVANLHSTNLHKLSIWIKYETVQNINAIQKFPVEVEVFNK